MPSFRVEVDGVEREIRLDMFVQHVVNGPDVLEGWIQDPDGSQKPAREAVVELFQTDVSPESTYFKGILQTLGSQTWTGHGYARLRRITAFDYGVYAQLVQIETLTVSASDTISTFVAAIASRLSEYGVTVHPSQATGPTLDPNVFDGQYTEAALNAISEQKGWVWKIDDQLRLRMWDPLTEAAGFNVTATNGGYVEDIRSENIEQRSYNRIFVEIGEGYTQSIINEQHFGDSSKTTFEMNAPMHYFEVDYTASLGFAVGLTLLVYRTSGMTVEYANDALTAQWTFNRGPDYSLTQVSGVVLGPTEYIEIPGYSAQWPMRLVADGRGSPPDPARDLRLVRPLMFSRQAGQTLADEVLSASNAEFERVSYPTDMMDIRPGETQSINVPEAGVNDSYTCVTARLFYVQGGSTSDFRLDVSLVTAVTARSIWLDLYRRWLTDNQGSSAAAPASAGTIGPPIGPAGPIHAIQFKGTNGQFAGNKYVMVSDAETGGHVGDDHDDNGDHNWLVGIGHTVN